MFKTAIPPAKSNNISPPTFSITTPSPLFIKVGTVLKTPRL